ncbi:60S ribosomal protein RL27 [Salpingoeca rosetta]|uniref:60S ribosomal protein RL27 n=1 Tax=Salpingoeca rosetta (strain ATCC 50818 / BSB-021) TaxID=946362 RepID=F2UE66_SALR5|nr:60S ribosomal protein RL27 [Salpingoeca rosetta]EGD74916.1 60S ribosomal protein RL27 [Salpingoeca rosetta]|eukprot:XP_004992561.1 60S ribosomal protein RL27 [Salpingoeca rosetta]
MVQQQRFLKEKKVVLILSGRYAGKKAAIVSHSDEGDKKHKFGHCLVVGLEKPPRKITKDMGVKKRAKRSRMVPFVKVINTNHIMPTRYSLNLKFNKDVVSKEALKNPVKKAAARKEVKKQLSRHFKKGENTWFFSKLRF